MYWQTPHQDLKPDRALLWIISGVISIHLLAIVIAFATSATSKLFPIQNQKRLVVQTIALSPQVLPPLRNAESIQKKELQPIIQTESHLEEEEIEQEPTKEIPINEPIEQITPKDESKPTPQPIKKELPPKPVVPKPKTAAKSAPIPKAPKAKAPIAPKKAAKPKEEKIKPAVKKIVPIKKVDTTPKTPPIDKATLEQQKTKEAETKALIEQQKQALIEEKAANQKKLELLAEAQERIAKIGKNRDKGAAQSTTTTSINATPRSITSLQIDGLASSDGPQLSDKEMSYRDEIAGRLKLLLRLPQFGAVKVKLTLNRLGKVVKVNVINAESNENKKHIEKTLPTLTFPPYGSQFSDEEYTLTITLKNE